MEQKELDGKVWEVSGFVFENEDQAKLAKKEVEGIQYIHDYNTETKAVNP